MLIHFSFKAIYLFYLPDIVFFYSYSTTVFVLLSSEHRMDFSEWDWTAHALDEDEQTSDNVKGAGVSDNTCIFILVFAHVRHILWCCVC